MNFYIFNKSMIIEVGVLSFSPTALPYISSYSSFLPQLGQFFVNKFLNNSSETPYSGSAQPKGV